MPGASFNAAQLAVIGAHGQLPKLDLAFLLRFYAEMHVGIPAVLQVIFQRGPTPRAGPTNPLHCLATEASPYKPIPPPYFALLWRLWSFSKNICPSATQLSPLAIESMPPASLAPALRKHLMELETLARFGCAPAQCSMPRTFSSPASSTADHGWSFRLVQLARDMRLSID